MNDDNIHKHIVLFDGVCNLCNSSVRFIIKHDHKQIFRFAAMQSDFSKDLLKRYKAEHISNKTLVYICSGNIYVKSTAALLISRELNRLWRFLYYLIYIPAPIRDSIYMLISRNRYRIFGKRETCEIPDNKIKDRFITS